MAKALLPPPPPDGGYPNYNTAEGDNALFNLTTGHSNTANGFDALFHNTTGVSNTAFGINALFSNISGDQNTAIGDAALYSNTNGIFNAATGYEALLNNRDGSYNTADGAYALLHNTTINRLSGTFNTATGYGALSTNTIGSNNTGNGYQAMFSNLTGNNNTVSGVQALFRNQTGFANTAMGYNALFNNSGSSNIAIGGAAGLNLTTGSNNIDIGAPGMAGESDKIRIGTQGTQNGTFIAGISGVVVSGTHVVVNANGKLGVAASSARFKQGIKPMDKASEAILALEPVTFRYKHELDPDGLVQFGLVAEQVEKVNPDLVVRDANGKVMTVRYDAVNVMLLNEFLKEHNKVEEQQATISELKRKFALTSRKQQKEIDALIAQLKEHASQIQKVSARIEMGKFATERIHRRGPAPQVVVNNP
jgi:hypothetical protein